METAEIKGGLGVGYAQQGSVKVITSEGNSATMSTDDAMNMPGNSCARAMRLMYLYPQHFKNHETLRVGSVGWLHPETENHFGSLVKRTELLKKAQKIKNSQCH